MNLDLIKRVWNFVHNLHPQLKSLIIVILCIACYELMTVNRNYKLLEDYQDKIASEEYNAEQYTLTISPVVNAHIENILRNDEQAFNVLLLNYHNSKRSLQGLRYVYLNCISEKLKGFETQPAKPHWNELEYIYYEDELAKIHANGYLRIECVDSVRRVFPKLCRRLEASGAEAAAFYPIEGINSSIGMILILYKEQKKYELGYYNTKIAPYIQKLSTLLDYPNIKNFEMTNANRQTKRIGGVQ